jgi:hypothetical protein
LLSDCSLDLIYIFITRALDSWRRRTIERTHQTSRYWELDQYRRILTASHWKAVPRALAQSPKSFH